MEKCDKNSEKEKCVIKNDTCEMVIVCIKKIKYFMIKYFHINSSYIDYKSNTDIIILTPGKCSMNGNAMNGKARKTYRNMPIAWRLAPSVPSSIVTNIVRLVSIGII